MFSAPSGNLSGQSRRTWKLRACPNFAYRKGFTFITFHAKQRICCNRWTNYFGVWNKISMFKRQKQDCYSKSLFQRQRFLWLPATQWMLFPKTKWSQHLRKQEFFPWCEAKITADKLVGDPSPSASSESPEPARDVTNAPNSTEVERSTGSIIMDVFQWTMDRT